MAAGGGVAAPLDGAVQAVTDLIIRAEDPADPEDRRFVDSTWVTNFRQSHDAGPLPRDTSWRAYCEAIERLRARPTARIAVATRPLVPDHRIAFIAWEDGGHHRHPVTVRSRARSNRTEVVLAICQAPALWYVYVEQPQRGDGVAAALLAHAGINPKLRFCFQYRTIDMRDRVQGERLKDGERRQPRRPWPGGRFDPRTYLSLEDEQLPKEQPT